ncbi:uncharacterized protein TRIREDRAFT_2268 [Trichoderma reesei QM6a]|uniref:Predicted protein n=1 Tax=Hypocrea jecorina (strain QM6a) TaxID=431241 RepID=G0RAT6_HYPJQ|nr:uncharacterized protein TRIREDRAFT_2268 [Trichoderma reesei QM6a]EGR51915.1 predicted protein [Trichoderma reesei QM6a]
MTAVRGPRLQVGSAAWVGEERASALQIVKSEVEEFSYSAHNEIEWLNEHMAAILNEGEVNITEVFKTPGKLRGKTPHTARKGNAAEARMPLSDVFAASSTDSSSQHSDQSSHSQPRQLHQVALKAVPLVTKPVSPQRHVFSPSRSRPHRGMQDSGYYGSQDHIATDPSESVEPEDFANPYSDIVLPPGGSSVRRSPVRKIVPVSPSKTFQPPKDGPTTRTLPKDVSSGMAPDEPETSAKEFDSDEAYSDAPVISPVREPLNSGKSLGARQSRNSHFDTGNSSRTSYYQRHTGGKSLGNLAKRDSLHEENEGESRHNAEGVSPAQEIAESDRPGVNHTKTYTQRLQDQISMLSKPQSGFAQTKTTTNAAALQQEVIQAQSITSPKPAPLEKEPATTTPPLAKDTATASNALPISFTNLAALQDDLTDNPFKSPPRRESPLKQVKSKLSSILKSSRGLLASNAAVNVDGKALMSPSTTRLALHAGASTDSIALKAQEFEPQPTEPTSPSKPIARRTRASTEREKEQKRRENEVKRMEEQMDKLDKAREKERERARAFTQEQEKVATMEQEVATKRQDERLAFKATPNPPKAGPSSPRKPRADEETQSRQVDRDVDMSDAQPPMPPPSSTKSTLPGPVARGKDSKRPVKPIKDSASKIKAPPTVIRVNTGSQHSQYQPAGSRVSTASHDTLNSNHSTASSKSGKSIYQAKSSAPNVKAPPSAGRSKAAEMAARKKEQDERESQRRREAKAEMERKRIAAQEEQRKQDQQRRLEIERQRQQEEEKKSAQRQAAIEKAKQTRAPPPAVRSQQNGTAESALPQPKSASSRADGQPARPPSRLASMRDDLGRPVNTVLSNAAKAGAKRTFGPETSDDTYSRPPPTRGGPAYQTKDSKRRRTSEHNDEVSEVDSAPKIKGPPVRPSTGFKKDLPTKSAFQNGYAAAPHSASRDLFKAAVTSQHHSHAKAAHPLDMAQISKGPIPFAPSSSAAGSSHKTPARPGQLASAKGSVRKASPRFQNGDSIELPEIQTDDDEDDDDEGGGMTVAAWADSPDLRRALMRQESMDPTQIFGPPAPLIMEEVFNKSKDKWHKFRQRTSSANWSGLDRLTEDDIRKDMAARDKLRRDGGWSYEMSKDML